MSDLRPAPDLVDTRFRSPPFWHRSVVYFANLRSLFFGNHEQTAELARQVGEIDSYGGRLAPALNLIYRGGKNTLVLERPPDAALLDYFEHGLALSLPRIGEMRESDRSAQEPPPHRVAELRPDPSAWIDGYVTDESLAAWARAAGCRTISSESGSRDGNNKTKLYLHLAEQGLPTPDTLLATTPDETLEALGELHRRGYRQAAIRAAVGASGIGMMKAELPAQEDLAIPAMLFHEGACLVQGWLEPGVHGIKSLTSPSVQLFLDEGSVYAFDITDQILSTESIHEGNQSPPAELDESLRQELVGQAGEVGRWLHQQGYRGTASADFLVARRSGSARPTVYVCEVNARVTGATYPSVVARHLLPEGAWLMRNLRLEFPIEGSRLLELIQAAGYLLKSGDDRGVAPLNFNFDSEGRARKGQFLCVAPTVDDCRAMLISLANALPFKTQPERD